MSTCYSASSPAWLRRAAQRPARGISPLPLHCRQCLCALNLIQGALGCLSIALPAPHNALQLLQPLAWVHGAEGAHSVKRDEDVRESGAP